MERIQKLGWTLIIIGGSLLVLALFGFFIQNWHITFNDILSMGIVLLSGFIYWFTWGKLNLEKGRVWLCLGPLFLGKAVVFFVRLAASSPTAELVGDVMMSLIFISWGYTYVQNENQSVH